MRNLEQEGKQRHLAVRGRHREATGRNKRIDSGTWKEQSASRKSEVDQQLFLTPQRIL